MGKICVINGFSDIYVMDTTLLKIDNDSQLGNRLNSDDGTEEMLYHDMEVDSTCIVVSKNLSNQGIIKLDF